MIARRRIQTIGRPCADAGCANAATCWVDGMPRCERHARRAVEGMARLRTRGKRIDWRMHVDWSEGR